jgi:hypothetical protein
MTLAEGHSRYRVCVQNCKTRRRNPFEQLLAHGERRCVSAPRTTENLEEKPLRAITQSKPQNLHFFLRTRHRRPFLYLAPCGGEWQKTLDCRAFCHCGPFLDLARCGPLGLAQSRIQYALTRFPFFVSFVCFVVLSSSSSHTGESHRCPPPPAVIRS